MNTNKYIALLLTAILYFSSCAGSKKIDFSTAYKFSRHNYQKVNNQPLAKKENNIATTELYASTSSISLENQDDNLERLEQNILDKINVTKAEANRMEPEALANKISLMDRKQKKALKKEIKAELKHLKIQEPENPSSVKESNQTNELTDYMRWSIIIGSVGLVLLLLGAIFSVGFLSIVGALAIVGAAVLFILDQV
jgi:hypothetical protein